MKILGIAASARKGGNSEILLDEALRGARKNKAKTEKIVLNKLNIKPCDADNYCRSAGRCRIKDDMQLIYKKLKSADAVIVASPVYFGSIPAQLKAMIDRCQAIWAENFIIKKRRPRLSKRGAFICVSAHSKPSFFNNSKKVIEIFFMVLGIRLFRQIYVSGLEHPSEVLKRSSALNKAYLLGAELAKKPYKGLDF